MTSERTVPHALPSVPLVALKVEVIAGPDAGRIHTASADTMTVGTAPGNELVLTDDTVSRYHLELTRKGDRIFVRDHGSTNGVAVGGALIERASVLPGTVLRLGKTTLEVGDGASVELELHQEDRFGGVRGRSPQMRSLMARLARAAESEVAVLLVGETGTGKELIARAIHEASARASGPFEVVDSAALLPALVASELFGHEPGAFPGADQRRIGAFERAHGGTLFLDEIGELPAALQPALLGVLERKSFRRVGGQELLHADVRVIAATSRDLRSEVNAGRLRQDLYYRLAVALLGVPPLRERLGDVPVLVEHFLREAGHDGPIEGIIGPKVMQALLEHRWPGNVRELRNFVDAALAMGETPRLEDPALPPDDGGGLIRAEALERLVRAAYKDARAALLDEFETHYLGALMQRTRHNVSKAAREAQMNRSYLIEMLKRHQIR